MHSRSLPIHSTKAMNWEAHACLPLHPDADFSPLDRLRDAGVHYVSVNVGMDMNPVSQILSVLAAYRARIAAHPDRFRLVASVAEIEQAAANGALAVGFDLEGALPLLGQPDMVALYRDLGVRQIHFAYNRNNPVADGCHDVERGLTPLGRRMVEAVNRAGVLMDCSHTGRRCSLDIMAASSQPVIFSHANPLALVAHGRNLSDEQIRACAATGGVVCISGVSAFLGTGTPGLNDNPPGHYDPAYWWPAAAGYQDALGSITYTPLETWRLLPEALQKVGMNAAEAAGVMGNNMLRVAGQVWQRP